MTKYAVYSAVSEDGHFIRSGRYLADSDKAARATLERFPAGTRIIYICTVYTVIEATHLIEHLNMMKSTPPQAPEKAPKVVKSNGKTQVIRKKAVFA